MAEVDILQFAPFSSAVDAGFWHNFTQLKLDVLHLSDDPLPVAGSYVNSDPPGLPSRLSVEYDALNRTTASSNLSCFAPGILINTNTIEEFRNRDKQDILKASANTMWEAMISDSALENPSVLTSFVVFTFADLKKYRYYYWFAFPAFVLPKPYSLVKPPQSVSEQFTSDQVSSLIETYSNLNSEINGGFFTIIKNKEGFTISHLKDYVHLKTQAEGTDREIYLGFSDPSTLAINPGWPLRNLLTLVTLKWGSKITQHKVICLRVRMRNGVKDGSHSLVVEVDVKEVFSSVDPSLMPTFLGWEKNERGKMGPRMVNLSANMDPTKLASCAVDLNLKLMRWRVAPQLNLDIVKQTRCLLLGAGTLGCSVARCLLGWGVQTITLVDNGKISYSNPVRQNLFTFEDCLSGGKNKATAAAEALKQIYPKVNSSGVTLSIPMPGHRVGESLVSQVHEDVATLEKLVHEHDALFLLMDSRESRWLPTLLGAANSKLVMTAALGFDSFLVMRHGYRSDSEPTHWENTESHNIPRGPIPGYMLGCYFCNDVVAPGDSLQDRTLDQQCTVTRPGVSYLAAAHVTELLISLLQHPDKGLAEAGVSEGQDIKEGVLGVVPHSLRGFLGTHQLLTPATTAFKQCPACCNNVISAYKQDGFDFLLKVFNSNTYLEEVSGLSSLQHCVDDSQIWELSDEEDE